MNDGHYIMRRRGRDRELSVVVSVDAATVMCVLCMNVNAQPGARCSNDVRGARTGSLLSATSYVQQPSHCV